MDLYMMSYKLSRVFILAIGLFACANCYAEWGYHPGGYYHSGGGGYYHQGGGGYYHQGGWGYYPGGYYQDGGWVTPGVVISAPACQIIQECYPDGDCIQTQVCD